MVARSACGFFDFARRAGVSLPGLRSRAVYLYDVLGGIKTRVFAGEKPALSILYAPVAFSPQRAVFSATKNGFSGNFWIFQYKLCDCFPANVVLAGQKNSDMCSDE